MHKWQLIRLRLPSHWTSDVLLLWIFVGLWLSLCIRLHHVIWRVNTQKRVLEQEKKRADSSIALLYPEKAQYRNLCSHWIAVWMFPTLAPTPRSHIHADRSNKGEIGSGFCLSIDLNYWCLGSFIGPQSHSLFFDYFHSASVSVSICASPLSC